VRTGRRRLVRLLAWLLVVAVTVAVVALTWWVVRLPDAEEARVGAVLAAHDVEVVDAGGVVTVHPPGPVERALVFVPGAGVPAEAYLPTLVPVAAETGTTVLVTSAPLRLAILGRGRADAARDAAGLPDDAAWWIAGHSLGGAVATMVVADADPGRWDGVLLWGAYPSAGSSLADVDDLEVVSIVGERDGLSTPADVEGRRDLLPPAAEIVVLDGVNHAQFGAYGPQRGDGTAAVSDAEAASAVVDATAAALRAGP
jgi:hypothetical protein